MTVKILIIKMMKMSILCSNRIINDALGTIFSSKRLFFGKI